MSLNNQFYLLIHTILYGIFLGLMFDTLSMLLVRFKKKIIRDILVVIYWALQIPLAVLYFHRINQGEFQSYLLIFVLLGGLVYFKTLRHDYLERLCEFKEVCGQIYKFVKKLLNVIFFRPLAFIFKFISAIIVIPRKFFRKKRTDDCDKELGQDEELQSN